jgi:hypothetical protein
MPPEWSWIEEEDFLRGAMEILWKIMLTFGSFKPILPVCYLGELSRFSGSRDFSRFPRVLCAEV